MDREFKWLMDVIELREHLAKKDAVRFYIKNRDAQKKLGFKDYELKRNSVGNHKSSQYKKKRMSKKDEMVALNKINANIEKYLSP